MKITIEVDSYSNEDYFDKITSEFILSKNIFKLDPLGCGIEEYFYVESAESQCSMSGLSKTIVIRSCSKPKSDEELAAEKAVAKAKEALKAAKESLKAIKEGK